MAPILEAKNLIKQYKGTEQTAVSDISFALERGEIMALLGPNGAGKTTIIKMILGLITPTSGTAKVFDFDMSVSKERNAGIRHMGAVLEGARNVYWRLSARANLHYFGNLRGLSRKYLHDRTEELLDFVGLRDVADKEVRLFSRGMQQKLAFAVALLPDPEILLLDEPTIGLDVQAAKLIEHKIQELSANGKTVLLTTHMMSLVERLATRTLVIHNGRKVAHDTTNNLLKQFHMGKTFELRVEGNIPKDFQRQIFEYFPSLLIQSDDDYTLLVWREPEQYQVVQLYELMDKNGQTVLSIKQREASLEEVFLSLTKEAA